MKLTFNGTRFTGKKSGINDNPGIYDASEFQYAIQFKSNFHDELEDVLKLTWIYMIQYRGIILYELESTTQFAIEGEYEIPDGKEIKQIVVFCYHHLLKAFTDNKYELPRFTQITGIETMDFTEAISYVKDTFHMVVPVD
jgi:hypothetical protein